jgi:hypothetical protein
MAMPFQKYNILSQDVSIAIKRYCWDNLGEFYRRYKIELNVSQATFYRAISGDYSTDKTINAIMKVVDDFKIGYDQKTENSWEIKKIFVKGLLEACDTFLENASIQNMNHLKMYVENHRGDLT